MIEVVVDQTGDRAEAGSPMAALFAALLLCDDIWEARGVMGLELSVTFWSDGQVVRAAVPEAEIWATIGRHGEVETGDPNMN